MRGEALVVHSLVTVELDGIQSYFPTKASPLWLLNIYYKCT